MSEGTPSSTSTRRVIVEILHEESTARVATTSTFDGHEEVATAFWVDGRPYTRRFAGLWIAGPHDEGVDELMDSWIEPINEIVGVAEIVGHKTVDGRAALQARLDKETLKRLAESDEERMLLDRFGDAYRDYMQRTGRYFPRLF